MSEPSIPRFRVFSLVATSILSIGVLTAQVMPEQRPNGQRYNEAIKSANAIALHAKAVVYGKVRSVEPTTYSNKELGILRFETRTVEVELLPMYPGQATAPERLVKVEELVEGARAIEPGETILWFLGKKSTYGFQQTVGPRGGDFRVVTHGRSKSGQAVVNGYDNEDLWADSFWDESANTSATKAKLFKHWNREIAAAAFEVGAKKCCDVVPLELMLAMAAAKFNSQYPSVIR